MISKEKTMLKWLKQKPSSEKNGGGGGLGGGGILPIEKITDDPLATIQVHALGASKKNKNKANEIYAVSRVNPLFEEEDGKEVFSPGGHSGSSGYDSGSGPSDDDFPIIHNVAGDLKDLQTNLLGRLGPTPPPPTTVQTAVIPPPHHNHPQLFINTENDVIHHETAILGPNGRPVLQILEQNPAYVKSIALMQSVGGRKRPLSPISESVVASQQKAAQPQNKYNLSTSGTSLYNKDAKKPANNNYTTIDSIGSAKLVKKDSQYVRSIRIGGPTNFNPTPTGQTKRSILEQNRRFSNSSTASSSTSGIPGSRRPSVTFADDVGGGGSRSGSRKPSMEQDSIVTESLLMMTSVGGHRFAQLGGGGGSTASSRKTSFSSSQSKSQDESSEATVDLEAFANSLRKSRPIKQLRPGSSADNLEEDLEDSSSRSSKISYGEEDEHFPSDDVPVTVIVTPPPMDRIATLDRPSSQQSTPTSPRMHQSSKKSHKSPFGGIADHYAAAKEIAKEIESYSNGSAKASTKKSLVRDLLYRGNRNASSSASQNYEQINAIKGDAIISTVSGFRTGPSRQKQIQSPQLILPPPPPPQELLPQSPSPNVHYGTGRTLKQASTSGGGTNNDWELVRVQQVYVKAKEDQQQPPPMPALQAATGHHTSSSSSRSHQGQDHQTSNSRRHHHPSATPTSSKIPTATTTATHSSKAKSSKKVPSSSSSAVDDGLATTPGARSRSQQNHSKHSKNEETDSGNSSDRTYAEVRLEIEGQRIDLSSNSDHVIPLCDARIQVEAAGGDLSGEENFSPENLPSKVMIVTGDSQNIVVDLSGVPLDLKNAIVSGTALITLPDGLDTMLQPGYTMITIPASNTNTTASTRPMSPKSSTSTSSNSHHPHLHRTSKINGHDDNKPLVNTPSATVGGGAGVKKCGVNSDDDECKLFATKNKAQIWDVIQQTVGGKSPHLHHQDAGGGGKNKKKITTIFPFHPNQDAYESPDFTIEGHRLDRQRKKVDQEKRRRCACRLCGMLFFLLAFLGVLVALSMIYTRGQRYFGSSV